MIQIESSHHISAKYITFSLQILKKIVEEFSHCRLFQI